MSISLLQLKQIGIGLLTMAAVSIALALVPSIFPYAPFTSADDQFFWFQPLPTIEQSLKVGVAAFVGAYVARVPFVFAATVYYVCMTSYTFYVLTLIAEPVEPVSIFEVTARNSIGAGAGLIAAVVGASLGFRLSAARSHNRPEAI